MRRGEGGFLTTVGTDPQVSLRLVQSSNSSPKVASPPFLASQCFFSVSGKVKIFRPNKIRRPSGGIFLL